MSYVLLALAIVAEIIATTFLKYSDGFTKLFPSIACVIAYVFCYFTFSKAIREIDLGIAYATWCGVGIVATAVISFVVFKEKLSILGMVGVLFIVVGCILLNLFGSGH